MSSHWFEMVWTYTQGGIVNHFVFISQTPKSSWANLIVAKAEDMCCVSVGIATGNQTEELFTVFVCTIARRLSEFILC